MRLYHLNLHMRERVNVLILPSTLSSIYYVKYTGMMYFQLVGIKNMFSRKFFHLHCHMCSLGQLAEAQFNSVQFNLIYTAHSTIDIVTKQLHSYSFMNVDIDP